MGFLVAKERTAIVFEMAAIGHPVIGRLKLRERCDSTGWYPCHESCSINLAPSVRQPSVRASGNQGRRPRTSQ